MKKIVGITGSSMIGIDPYHPRSWSGSSRRFFLECNARGILERAFGVEVSKPVKYFYALKNYSPDRNKLITQYLMDPGYRRSLTRLIRQQLTGDDAEHDVLQLGALYDVPSLIRCRTRCYSYNDGNFAMSVHSPYFPKGIRASRIEQTLAYEREVNSGLDIIFTMSGFLRQSFIDDYGMLPDKVISIGAGINLDAMPEPAESKDYANENILFIGVDFARKGGFELIKAFRVVRERMPNALLHIIGPHRKIAGVSEAPGVVWHGFLDKNNPNDDARLKSIFAQSSLFVMPSLYEPFGIAPLEAMAHEVSCIVTNAWALPEIVPENICGRLVAPGDWEELAEQIIDLLRNPSKLAQYGRAGRVHVAENYTWNKVVNRLGQALYRP